jgi:hypothetical protein
LGKWFHQRNWRAEQAMGVQMPTVLHLEGDTFKNVKDAREWLVTHYAFLGNSLRNVQLR